MSIKSYFEEFNRRYNQPQINKVTVGFSGIDPSPKIETQDNPTHTGSTQEIIKDLTASDEEFDSMLKEVFGN